MAVRATRLGAVDFLEKPLSTDKLLLTVDNVLKLKRLEDENRELRQRVGKHEIVHSGEAMRRVMAQVDRVAASEARVCILGETGTGKELIARALHERSARRDGPFVTLNCAAVPGELIESELFGHEKGSFTGAASRHIGKFEQAHHGTLFLDEIGDMPLVMQAKLLRVLEEGRWSAWAATAPIPVDVRVIVATHRNLDELVKKGAFRQDLYHRIYVFPLLLPPLARAVRGHSRAGDPFRRAGVAEQNGWKPKPFDAEAPSRNCSATPGRAMSASCATWWSACCCWRMARWIARPYGWRCRRMRAKAPARSGAGIRRPPGPAHGFVRARTDSGRAEAPQSAHDRHRQGAGPGAQPSVQKVPGAGDRPARDAQRGRTPAL